MTKLQLNTAITSLLESAQNEVSQAAGTEGGPWIAHMAATKTIVALASALMAVRDKMEGAHQ